MRRSARLINQLGPLKRKAQEGTEPGKNTERISDASPRSRGLLQDVLAAEEDIVIAGYRVVAEASIDRAYPPSPFVQIEHNEGEEILPQLPIHDENTPPRKRRHISRAAEQAELTTADDEDGARPNQMDEGGSDFEDKQASHPSSWFTPIRSSRTPKHHKASESENVCPTFTRASSPMWPARMPSFAEWIDETAEEQPVGMSPVHNQRETPTQFGAGGVDMTEFAVLYDPQTAATATKSPLSPIERICQTASICGSSEDEME